MIDLLNTNFYNGFAKRTSEIIIAKNAVDELCTLLKRCICEPQKFKDELILKQQCHHTSKYKLSKCKKELSLNRQTVLGNIKKIDTSFIEKLEFRAAFVIETIYLGEHRSLLNNFISKIFLLLPQVINPSTKRHLGKIICKELEQIKLSANSKTLNTSNVVITDKTLCIIIDTMEEWAINPNAKPAVKIWAINTLFAIRKFYTQHPGVYFNASDKKLKLLESFLRDFIEYESVNPLPSMQVSLRLWINMLSKN